MDIFTIDQRPEVHDFRGQAKHLRWAQQKHNGYRVSIVRERGGVRAVPKKEHINYWPDLEKRPGLRNHVMSLPVDTVLDGELFIPGGHASSVPTHIKDATLPLAFSPFACPWFGGADWRINNLDIVMTKLHQLGFVVPVMQDISGWDVLTIEGWALELAKRMKWEGLVLKEEHWSGWYKVKPQKTADVVVIKKTLSDSETQYGMLKALIVGVYTEDGRLLEVANVGTGFDKPDRAKWANERLTGRVCEVEYQDVLSKGRLQFPRFLRWRDDKPAQQCLVSQFDMSKVVSED